MTSTLIRDLLALVLPVCCAGCEAIDQPWCPSCAQTLAGTARRCDGGAGRLDRLDGTTLPVWCVADFAGPVRAAVSAWKDHARADLGVVLGAALLRAGQAPPLVTLLRDAGPVFVVPAPSTAAAARRRGEQPAVRLARTLARGWRRDGVDATAVVALRRRGSGDLAGLSARSRAARLEGRVRVRGGIDLRGRSVVLVDDVLTSGATLAACERVLQGAGALVLAGVVVAATPPPGRPGSGVAAGTATGKVPGS